MKFRLEFLQKTSAANRGRKRFRTIQILLILLAVGLISYSLYIPERRSIRSDELNIGDIVHEDIIVLRDITFEDTAATEIKRKAARESVLPVYEWYPRTTKESTANISAWYEYIRQARRTYLKNRAELENIQQHLEKSFGIKLEETALRRLLVRNPLNRIDLNNLLRFLEDMEKRGILASKIGSQRGEDGTITLITATGEKQVVAVDSLYDLRDIENAINVFLGDQGLTGEDLNLVSSILMQLIDVNITYSVSLTREEQEEAVSQVNPSIIKLKEGKIIARKGDELTPEAKKLIELVAQEEEILERSIPMFYVILAIVAFLVFITRRFFISWNRKDPNREKIFPVILTTLTLSAIVYRAALFLFPLILRNSSLEFNFTAASVYYAVPFGMGALIVAFTFNIQTAVLYSFINAIIGGILCQWNLQVALYILISNLVVAYGIEYYQRLKRSPILKASLFWLMPVNLLAIMLFAISQSSMTTTTLLINLLLGAFSALFSSILASFIIPLWETSFQLISDLKLLELNNLNLPIFREMLEKAPGTYHHSQMVATLAETAALELGLSPLQLTAMALYHDIGKIENPQFFTENNTVYPNDPHEKLSPTESAKVIISHLDDGIERAKKLKVPHIVESAIRQHHGTKLMRFFYDKAVEKKDVETDDVDESLFRYPGTKPQTIENAVIMLADQVEAASKSLAKPTDEEIRNIIQTIIDTNIEEKQFDECDGLTFKSLNTIANSFLRKLSSIYHMRVSYPGFNFNGKEKPQTSG